MKYRFLIASRHHNVSTMTVDTPVCVAVGRQKDAAWRTVYKIITCFQEKRSEGIHMHVTGQLLERCLLYCIVLYCIVMYCNV
jgi:hypothetical protein